MLYAKGYPGRDRSRQHWLRMTQSAASPPNFQESFNSNLCTIIQAAILEDNMTVVHNIMNHYGIILQELFHKSGWHQGIKTGLTGRKEDEWQPSMWHYVRNVCYVLVTHKLVLLYLLTVQIILTYSYSRPLICLVSNHSEWI